MSQIDMGHLDPALVIMDSLRKWQSHFVFTLLNQRLVSLGELWIAQDVVLSDGVQAAGSQ